MLIAIAVLAFLPLRSFAAERPNIIVILCDDLGYADVGFNGSKDIVTPQLDNLANNGAIFTAAYVTHPFCGPSRMGLMSGRYAHTFGGQFNLPNSGHHEADYNQKGIPVEETLISKVLQDAGYFTGAIGKWHMGIDPQYHPNRRGFDDYYGFLGGGHRYFPEQYQGVYERQVKAGNKNINEYFLPLERNGERVRETEYITDGLSREAVRFVKEASTRDQPFFLYLAYNAPHSPLEAKEDDMARFADIKDDKRRTYAGMVYAVDRGVGELVKTLRATGEYDNTLIVFLSDNGGKIGLGANNAPLREGKGSCYEGGYRVPMFFHWPGRVKASTRYEHPVSSLDFYPTFAGLGDASIPKSKQLDGVDIWNDFIADRSARKGGMIYALRHRAGFNDVGVRRDDWKASRMYNGPWKLFNVANDISENNNLAAQYPERLREMIAETERWSRSHIDAQWFDSAGARDQWNQNNMPNYASTFQIASTASAPKPAKASPPEPVGDILKDSPGEWVFVPAFSDEFDGAEIDTKKWNIDTNDWGVWSWEPENASQQDGSLNLQMVQETHERGKSTFHYKSGIARSHATITYGYFEARIKGCPRYPGACPAFWLYSMGLDNRLRAKEGETMCYSEIDIVELQQCEWDINTREHHDVTRIDCNLHTILLRDGKKQWVRPGQRPDLCKNYFDAPWDPREEYHIYAVENTKDEIIWYIDGKEVARKPNLYWHLPMHVTLSMGLRYPFVKYENGERLRVPEKTTAEGFPTAMSVDYVRVWRKKSSKGQPVTKKAATDKTLQEFIALERAKWEKNGWRWNQKKVEENFAAIDTNGDRILSGRERKVWYDNLKASKK